MGFGDWLGGILGTTNNFHADPRVNSFQAQGNYGPAAQQAIGVAQGNLGQQGSYIQQLQQQASGGGAPSLAQMLLQQQTTRNNQQAAGAVASQRGVNPGLAAKLALDQGANQNQQAAGQGAMLRSQEQLQSQSLLGQALGQQGAQAQGLAGVTGGLDLGVQGINAGVSGQNAQLAFGADQLNAGVSAQNASTSAGLVGGLLGGVGSAAQMYASGGMKKAHGGAIPGHAQVAGDSPANDVVSAKLSPGEIVIPRSIAEAPDAGQQAMRFVDAIRAHRGGAGLKSGSPARMSGGGPVLDPGLGVDLGDDGTLPLPESWASPTAAKVAGGQNALTESPPPAQPMPEPAQASAPAFVGPPAPNLFTSAPSPSAKPSPDGTQGIPGIGELKKAGQQGQQAIMDEGAAKAKGLAGIADTATSAAQSAQDQATKDAEEIRFRIGEQDKRAKEVAEVNPHRYWQNLGTSGKISSAIGLVLGGIGAGLTKGPNYAFESIQKAIDTDIDAQKTNIHKKENELSAYMQGTHDLQAAQHALAAQHWAVAGAQIEAATAKMGSAAAAPAAQLAASQAKEKQITETQQYVERMQQIKGNQLSYDSAKMHGQAMQALLKGVSGGGGFPRQMLEMPGFEKYRERAVDLPDGSVGFASDKEQADEANKSMQAVSIIKSKLQRFSALLQSGNPATLDRGKAQALRADILAEMGHLHGLNRLSDKDLELFEKQVPDESDFIKPMAAQKLKALGQSIDDRTWSINKAVLHRPDLQRPGASAE